jgi:glycosyltransferase involved in cell wall biosynthesis
VKVLHVIPSVSRHDGGPSVAVRAMARGVAPLVERMTVATTDADGERRLPVPVDRPLMEEGVEYRHFPVTSGRRWKFSWPLTRWLRRHLRDYDVVHVHALFSYATLPACRFAQRSGVPYVLRPLGTLDPWSLAQHGWRKRPYLRLVERQHLRRAAAIHVTSPLEAEGVARLGFGHSVRLIPLGVEQPELPARGWTSGAVNLLFLSRLHPKKGLPVLLEAFARLAEREGGPRLTIAGGGTDSYRAEMQRLCDALGVQQRVSFVGHVEGARKERVLAEADIFVLPSSQENFGIAVAEALAAGLPVVVSPQVGLASEIAESGAGLVVENRPAELAEALGQLIENPQLRLSMGRRGAELARDRYSWNHTSRLLHELYLELVVRPASRPR